MGKRALARDLADTGRTQCPLDKLTFCTADRDHELSALVGMATRQRHCSLAIY